MELLELIKIATPLLAIGGAWGGAKVALNGTRQRVQKLEATTDLHVDRLARIETKVDIIVEKL